MNEVYNGEMKTGSKGQPWSKFTRGGVIIFPYNTSKCMILSMESQRFAEYGSQNG